MNDCAVSAVSCVWYKREYVKYMEQKYLWTLIGLALGMVDTSFRVQANRNVAFTPENENVNSIESLQKRQ